MIEDSEPREGDGIPSVQERIRRLEKEISCIQAKRVGITQAIESRNRTLARLKAQAAMCGPGAARSP